MKDNVIEWSRDKGTYGLKYVSVQAFKANFFFFLSRAKLREYSTEFGDFLSGLYGSWAQILDATGHFLTCRLFTLSL